MTCLCQDRTSCLALNQRFGSQLHWFVPAGLASWVRANAGVDPVNIHEMVWWQQETHARTNATVGETGPRLTKLSMNHNN